VQKRQRMGVRGGFLCPPERASWPKVGQVRRADLKIRQRLQKSPVLSLYFLRQRGQRPVSEQENMVVRLCTPVADMDEPAPSAVADTCSRCSVPVWVTMDQATPHPGLPQQLVCIPCALADTEMRSEVIKIMVDVRLAHLLLDPDGDGRD
jgi:hypothetical protein